MDYGSRGFVFAIGLIAVVAGAGSVVSDSVALGCGALAVAAYGAHLISLRRATDAAVRRAVEAERASVSAEREALARRAKEVAARTVQVEEQWKLLREMVQERIRRRAVPMEQGVPERDKKDDAPGAGRPVGGPRPEEGASRRDYSRW